MTPKEKANELVDKMYMSTEWLKEENYNPLQEYQRIKKCALIAVDEVLHYAKAHGFVGLTEFYEEVKQEIQKL
jgi:hypothetical protein